MTVGTEAGYVWSDGKKARMIHKGNKFPIKTIIASPEAVTGNGQLVANDLTRDRWVPHANLLGSPAALGSADWTATAITVGDDGLTLAETTAGGTHDLSQAFTFTAVEHVVAVKLERQTVPEILLSANDGTSTFRCFFDLRDKTVGTAINATGQIIDLGGGQYLATIRFTPVAATGVVEIYTADGSEGLAFVGSTDRTIKILQVSASLSVASLTFDTFKPEAATCFAVGAHNLGSSGSTVTFARASTELMLNGTFDTNTNNWTSFQSGILSVVGGQLQIENGVAGAGAAYQTITGLTVGQDYVFTLDIIDGTSLTNIVRAGFASGGTQYLNQTNLAPGSYEFIFTATNANLTITLYTGSITLGETALFDNVSVKQANAQGEAFTDKGSVSPTDDSAIMFFFDEDTASQWRVTITNGALPEVGVVQIADPLVFQRGLYAGFTPARMGRMTEVVTNISRTGELLGRSVKRTILDENYSWQNLTYDWVRANLDGPTGVIQSVETGAAFLAWRPSLTDDVSYIMRASAGAPSAAGIQALWNFQMSGEVYSYE